jgi:hypothetical protein
MSNSIKDDYINKNIINLNDNQLAVTLKDKILLFKI